MQAFGGAHQHKWFDLPEVRVGSDEKLRKSVHKEDHQSEWELKGLQKIS